jgi:hypothetical protein
LKKGGKMDTQKLAMDESTKIEEEWAHAEGTIVTSQPVMRIVEAGKLPTGQTLDVALPEISPAEYRRRSKAARKAKEESRKSSGARKQA